MEYFGALSILIVTEKDFSNDPNFVFSNENFYEIINQLKLIYNWNKYDIIFWDLGNGRLAVLKDNTSKFSVSTRLMHK